MVENDTSSTADNREMTAKLFAFVPIAYLFLFVVSFCRYLGAWWLDGNVHLTVVQPEDCDEQIDKHDGCQ